MPTPDGREAHAVPDGAPPHAIPPPGADAAPPPGPAAPGYTAAPGNSANAAGPGAPPDEAGREAAEEPLELGLDEALAREIPFRPLSISEMLDGALACIRMFPRAVLIPSLLITAVIQVAGSVAAYFFVRPIGPDAGADLILRSVGTQFALGVFGLVLSAFGIVLLAGLLGPVMGRGLLGAAVTLRGVWRDARPRLWRLAALALIVTVVPLLGLALPVLPFAVFIAVDAHPAAGLLAGFLGFPLGAVLMIWLYVLLVLSVPAVVMERETVTGALRRAWRLSKGGWWRTFGTLTLATLITVFMGFFALRIPFLIAQLIFFPDVAGSEGQMLMALTVDTVGRIVSWTVVLPFDAGVIALLYADRRMRREGFDLEVRTRLHERRSTGGFFEHWRPAPVLRQGTPSRGTP